MARWRKIGIMIPSDGDTAPNSMCEAISYSFTKVWNEEARRKAFSYMNCKPAGNANGELIYKITAKYLSRDGVLYNFSGIYDSSGYDFFTQIGKA